MSPQEKKAPASLTVADKSIQAILNKPYKEWTGRDLGIVTLYDSAADKTAPDYKRLFSSDGINIDDIYLLLTEKDRDTVLDYYDVYKWIIAAGRTATEAEFERQLYITKVISLMNTMSAGKQITDNYRQHNRQIPKRINELYGKLLPTKIFKVDRTAKDYNPVIKEILTAQSVIVSNTACVIAYNKMIELLGKAFAVPNLKKMQIAGFTEKEIKRDDLPFYERAYNFLFDLIAPEMSEIDMALFRVSLKPDYTLRCPKLLPAWTQAMKEWIKAKRYSNLLDIYPLTDALSDTLDADQTEFKRNLGNGNK